MKTSDLLVKEFAAFIGVSTNTIRRTVPKGEILATRVRTALRFDLQEVSTCMQRNVEAKLGTHSSRAPGGESGNSVPITWSVLSQWRGRTTLEIAG